MTRIGILLVMLLLSFVHASVTAALIARWDFNSVPPDADAASGSLQPLGTGTLTLVGDAAALFGTVAGGSTSDPAESDNSQVRFSRLPAQGSKNKAVGLEFELTSKGFELLTLSWDQYNSATASRYWRVLYTTDWFKWLEHQVVTNATASVWKRFVVPLIRSPP